MPVHRARGEIAEAVRRSTPPASAIDDIAVRRPTLDDVFLTLTGHAAEPRTGRRRTSSRGGGGGMSALATPSPTPLVVAKRNLLRIPRQPGPADRLHDPAVMFVLLFVYVFGGAIQTPGYDATWTS